MKKILSAALCALLLLTLLSACRAGGTEGDTLSVVVTIFPEYDWVMNLLGGESDAVRVTLLLDNGVDLHSYQPTVDDIVTVSGCDLFIYVGGESDEWVDDVLREARNKEMVVLNLLSVLGDAAKEEALLEGMEAETEEDEKGEKGPEYDEHIWLSLRSAALCVRAIEKELSALDPDRALTYAANAAAYLDQLAALDAEFASAVAASPKNALLFADRFPFRYLADDYGLTCYAAFSGCSAESEASFETVAFLAGKVDELGLHTVLTLESGDGRIAETVVAASQAKNAAIRTMDSMQSTTSADVKAGATYLSIMKKNLDALRAALQ